MDSMLRDLQDVQPGMIFSIVAKPIFFDASHEAYVLEDVSTGRRFSYRGLLELGFVRHTLFALQSVKQYPHQSPGHKGHQDP